MKINNGEKHVHITENAIPVRLSCDVAVAGGGPAGFTAALAAARTGADTVLVEAMPAILGNITGGPLEAIMTFHDGSSQVIGGIAEEFIEQCAKMGGSPGHVPDTVGYCKTITPFSPTIAKIAAFEMLQEAGVTILLQTCVGDCILENRKIRCIIAQSRNSRFAIEAKTFVDCTGDGDLSFTAGCNFEKGDENKCLQPMTSLMHLGEVDYGKLISYVIENKNDFKFYGDEAFDECISSYRAGKRKPLHLWGFGPILDRGFREGRLSLKRDEMHMMTGFYNSEVIVNFTRFDGDGTDPFDRTKAQIATILQANELYLWLREVIPAFERSHILSVGTVGIREGRRIKGRYCLTQEDLVNGRQFDTAVAKGAFPIDLHKPGGASMEYIRLNRSYSIPMESLMSADVGNLFMGGRCISCTHKAQASVRITATSMATGQSAGVMAAVSALNGSVMNDLNYREIRKILLNQNMILA